MLVSEIWVCLNPQITLSAFVPIVDCAMGKFPKTVSAKSAIFGECQSSPEYGEFLRFGGTRTFLKRKSFRKS